MGAGAGSTAEGGDDGGCGDGRGATGAAGATTKGGPVSAAGDGATAVDSAVHAASCRGGTAGVARGFCSDSIASASAAFCGAVAGGETTGAGGGLPSAAVGVAAA